MKKWISKRGFALTCISLIAVMLGTFGIQVTDRIDTSQEQGQYSLGIGQKVITLGYVADAAGAVDYVYDGVADDLLPIDLKGIETKLLKLGTYLSLKWFTNFNIDFDFSVYHQSKFNEIFSTPRLASSSSITYNFTEHLGLILKYQNIYDYKL